MQNDFVTEKTTEVKVLSKSQSPQMFNRISGRYDFLNHFLSFGQDIRWRRKAVAQIPSFSNQTLLDLATGTSDLILMACKKNPDFLRGIGIDPARKMVEIGREKIRKKGLCDRISLLLGDGVRLPLADSRIDAAMIAFGIRNIDQFEKGLHELFRVLKPGGRLIVLEFSIPTNPIIRRIYLFYFRSILPRLGGLLSGDRNAYQYLNQTVEDFVYGNDFCDKMRAVGFGYVEMIPLSWGIATIYVGNKGYGVQDG